MVLMAGMAMAGSVLAAPLVMGARVTSPVVEVPPERKPQRRHNRPRGRSRPWPRDFRQGLRTVVD